jgi:predicted Zn-dependent protease with MMP-like domain
VSAATAARPTVDDRLHRPDTARYFPGPARSASVSPAGAEAMTAMQSKSASAAPSLADLEGLAERAFRGLPAEVRRACAGLAIRVADFPDDDLLREMGIEDPFELTGLYEGTALTEKSVLDQPLQPDTVWLFRRPILEEWIERGDVALDRLVSHVLVHEIAHHLGWSDDDIRAVDDWTL